MIYQIAENNYFRSLYSNIDRSVFLLKETISILREKTAWINNGICSVVTKLFESELVEDLSGVIDYNAEKLTIYEWKDIVVNLCLLPK